MIGVVHLQLYLPTMTKKSSPIKEHCKYNLYSIKPLNKINKLKLIEKIIT